MVRLFPKQHTTLEQLKKLGEKKNPQPKDLDTFVEIESRLLGMTIPDKHEEIRRAYLGAHMALFDLDKGTRNPFLGGTDYKMCRIEELMNHIDNQTVRATKVA